MSESRIFSSESRITRISRIIADFKERFSKSMPLCCSLDSLEISRETAYNSVSIL